MKRIFTTLAVGAALIAFSAPASAQENLLLDKPIYPLGGAMTWTAGDASYTFITDDLSKLVQSPTNTSNVFLYPENGTLNTAENQEKGAQPFYVDMKAVYEVGTVITTWEGAAADSYNIFLTDDVPTLETLKGEPTYSVTGLGQYTSNTAKLPAGSKGRYLVFQVTKATNWGWGVKIRSISAEAPTDNVLTTFSVSPAIVVLGEETPVTYTLLNQYGFSMADEVTVSVSGDVTFTDNNLTINSGSSATFTAKSANETLTFTVYVATAPSVPNVSDIKTPIYTNGENTNNSTAEFVTDWNGGATKGGELEFTDGTVAQLFTDARCIFFSNSETTGAWNGNINPTEKGYAALCLDVFSAKAVQCSIEFESVENLGGGHTYYFDLKAGEWNNISVDVAGATKLGNLSIRFTEANMDDILLANIYFTPSEPTYYLVGTLTTNEGLPSGYPNPSFQFVKSTQDDTPVYTLEVASVTADDSFYVQTGTIVYGSSEYPATAGMKPGETKAELTADNEGKLFLNASYVNVTFTLTPDANDPNLLTLTFTGTPSTKFAVTVGNDKTEQSGSVTEDKITLDTKNDYASIFVYSQDPVYYQITGQSNLQETNGVNALADTDYIEAPYDEQYSGGAYMISLPVNTTGTLVLATKAANSNDYVEQGTYTYTVNFSIPTGVEGIDSDNAEAEYYTLQGVKVANPDKGVFIKVAGGKAVKVVL